MFKLHPTSPSDKKLRITCPPVREGAHPSYLELDFDGSDETLAMAAAITQTLRKHFPSPGPGLAELKSFVIALGTDQMVGLDLREAINKVLKAHESQRFEVLSASVHIAKEWTWLTVISKDLG